MSSSDSQRALVPVKDDSKAVALISTEFKAPKPKKKILEEDDYEESITKIIERDYYPDLPKLKAQSEYLEAKASNDTEKLRELHIKFGPKRERVGRAGTSASTTSDIYATPAGFETPTITKDKLSTPAPEGASTVKSEKKNTNKETATDDSDVSANTNLRLDEFLSSHTSEDNEAFVELMEEFERKRREKQAWLYVKEGEQKELENKHLELPSAEEQAALQGNPTKLETWTYKPANALMYNVEGAELTAEEKIELASKVKEINPTATRFTGNPFKEPAMPSLGIVPVYKQHRGVPGRVDVDGKEIGPATPNVGGYNFVATPISNPGALGESPMMTWGEIEGTPFLLDASDRPLKPVTPGPTFKLRDEPLRDKIGRQLAENVAKQHRDKKNQVVERMKNRLTSPAGMTRTERLATLSPAARKLAETRGINLATDKALKASYTPSPLHRPRTGTRTPSHTPKEGSTSTTRVPKTLTTHEKRTPNNPTIDLTANLLNLPTKRKSKAADFF